jgi:hypothetical protein
LEKQHAFFYASRRVDAGDAARRTACSCKLAPSTYDTPYIRSTHSAWHCTLNDAARMPATPCACLRRGGELAIRRSGGPRMQTARRARAACMREYGTTYGHEQASMAYELALCVTGGHSEWGECGMPALGPCMFALVLGSPSGGSACSGHQNWTLVPVLYRRARVCGTRPAEDGLLRIETLSCETREPRLYSFPSSQRWRCLCATEAIRRLRR